MEKESGCWKKRFTYSYKEREEDKGGIYAFKVKSRKDIISFHNCEHRYIIHTCPDKACLKGSFVNRELPS